MMPLVTTGMVVSQDPANGGVNVVLKTSLGGPAISVRMTYEYADPLRIKQSPLPVKGTWGILLFPYGDVRNGFWLRSYLPSQQDAINASSPSANPQDAVTDAFQDYEAHWSGYWRLLDYKGQETIVWPDGTTLVIGLGTAVPTTYRHVVENNAKTQSEFTQGQRVPNPPEPFLVNINFANGFSILINGSGGVTINFPSGEFFNITQNEISPSDSLVLVSKFLSAFNTHVHGGVQRGGSATDPPVTQLTTSDVETGIINISN